eukprot:scaffold8631_cov28-Tisochrysis_lutea.AAC.9
MFQRCHAVANGEAILHSQNGTCGGPKKDVRPVPASTSTPPAHRVPSIETAARRAMTLPDGSTSEFIY